MNAFQSFLALLGRICLGAIFLQSGVGKIFDFNTTAEFMAAKGMPYVPILLAGTILFQILGSIFLILGYKTRIGAFLLILFLVPAIIIFQDFWNAEEAKYAMARIMFLKDLAILGGLLAFAAFGPGRLSVDKQ